MSASPQQEPERQPGDLGSRQKQKGKSRKEKESSKKKHHRHHHHKSEGEQAQQRTPKKGDTEKKKEKEEKKPSSKHKSKEGKLSPTEGEDSKHSTHKQHHHKHHHKHNEEDAKLETQVIPHEDASDAVVETKPAVGDSPNEGGKTYSVYGASVSGSDLENWDAPSPPQHPAAQIEGNPNSPGAKNDIPSKPVTEAMFIEENATFKPVTAKAQLLEPPKSPKARKGDSAEKEKRDRKAGDDRVAVLVSLAEQWDRAENYGEFMREVARLMMASFTFVRSLLCGFLLCSVLGTYSPYVESNFVLWYSQVSLALQKAVMLMAYYCAVCASLPWVVTSATSKRLSYSIRSLVLGSSTASHPSTQPQPSPPPPPVSVHGCMYKLVFVVYWFVFLASVVCSIVDDYFHPSMIDFSHRKAANCTSPIQVFWPTNSTYTSLSDPTSTTTFTTSNGTAFHTSVPPAVAVFHAFHVARFVAATLGCAVLGYYTEIFTPHVVVVPAER